MLRWVILAVVVVALTAIATVAMQFVPSGSDAPWNLPVSSADRGPAPKAEVDNELTYEFGEMSQQSTGTRTWKITNVGDADLEIWKGTSTCMCTIAKLKEGDKMVLKPGESTDIDLEWDTNTQSGDFHKGANIETNDPDRPTIPLFVHGKVNPPVVVIPGDTIDLHNIASDDPKPTFMALYSPDRPETKITEIKTSRPEFLTTEIVPMSESELESGDIKAGQKININLQPGFPIGTLREELVIHTDHPLRPEIRVMVVGTVSGPISVLPERVRMMSVKSKDGGSVGLTLLVRGGMETKFEVAQKPEKIDVSIEPSGSDTVKGRYTLKVDVPKGTPVGLIDGDIVLKTDQANAGELKIPVSILVGAN